MFGRLEEIRTKAYGVIKGSQEEKPYKDETSTLLRKNSHLNFEQSKSGRYPIHWLAALGWLDILKYNIENNPELLKHIDALDINGCTPLYFAVQNGHLNTAQYLFSLGATGLADHVTFEGVRLNSTLLHVAVFRYKLSLGMLPKTIEPTESEIKQMVSYLLDRKYDPNARDVYGQTPLFIAAGRGYPIVVELLTQRGAKVNIPSYTKEQLHHNPTAEKAHHEPGWVSLHKAVCEPPETKKGEQYRSLKRSSSHVEVVKFLLRSGASHYAKTADGKTPLMLAKEIPDKEIQDQMVQQLTSARNKEIAKYSVVAAVSIVGLFLLRKFLPKVTYATTSIAPIRNIRNP